MHRNNKHKSCAKMDLDNCNVCTDKSCEAFLQPEKDNREKKLCDENCNNCPIINHPNNRMMTKILNKAFEKYGNEFYLIVQDLCPNLTVRFDCRIDDFCHIEGCELKK